MIPPLTELKKTGDYIRSLQRPSGAIPWFAGGIVDPWDHVEAMMGLSIAGHHEAARKGFAWLQATQRRDGSWYAAYDDLEPADTGRSETNFVAYPATGLWHFYRVTGDLATVQTYWPMVRDAMTYVLRLQSPHGEIYWAEDHNKGISRDALVTGCSSIYKSLQCCAALAQTLGESPVPWLQAREDLGEAIRNKPHRFDRTWVSKARYSMDWFYPVLTGVVRGESAAARLASRWSEFVEPQLGCRCVVEEPWVTVAETCELIMACVGAGLEQEALQLFKQIQQFQLPDGSWWTGYVFTDAVHWPDEQPTWTAAAVLLAADALFALTPAHIVFKHHELTPDA